MDAKLVQGRLRLSADVGGTFTDVAAFDEPTGKLMLGKTLTTHQRLVTGIETGVDKAGASFPQAQLFLHGTTVAINTILERTGAPCALLTTQGFRDIYEIGRVNRPEAYNLFFQKHKPLIDRDMRFDIRERCDAQGRVLAALEEAGGAMLEEELLAAAKVSASVLGTLEKHGLVERVRRHASGREGMVRVGVSAGISTRLLPRMLEALAARSPGVEIRLEAVGSAESMQRLKAGTLDIAIVASPQPPLAEVKQTPWRNDPMVALLPAAWEAPDRIGPDWLASRRWASFAPATQMHGLIANWFGQAGHHPRPFLALSYPGALKSLAVASQCAALLPMEEVEDLQGTPGVQIRPLQPPLMRPMAVAHRHQPPPSPAVEGVLELLAEFAGLAE